MKHKTDFENMNATQRSLHNLCCILDSDDLLSYEQAISNAIDEITELKQQPDELLALLERVHIEAYGGELSSETWDEIDLAVTKHKAQGDV